MPNLPQMSDESKTKLIDALKGFITAVGIPAVICGVLLWFSGQDKIKTDKRLDELQATQKETEKWIRDSLMRCMTDSTQAIQNVTRAMEESSDAKERLVLSMDKNALLLQGLGNSIEELHEDHTKLLSKEKQ